MNENNTDEIEIEETDFSATEELQPNSRKIQIEQDDSPAQSSRDFHSENWFGKEGELAIDVYQTPHDIVIQTAIAVYQKNIRERV